MINKYVEKRFDNNGVLVLAGGLDVVKTVTYLKGSKVKLVS